MARRREGREGEKARIASLCVFCGSHEGLRPAYRAAAARLGREAARRGIAIIYGGGSIGLMGVVARAALHDVAAEVGGWETAEHPWEGGSDHDVFLRRGVPAVLFWHFTDFTYHTGLDRLDRIDPEELRRSSVAVLATALAIADPRRPDLARYRQGVELERALRVEVAREAGRLETAQDWEEWCDGALAWIDERLAVPRGDGAEREDAEESDR